MGKFIKSRQAKKAKFIFKHDGTAITKSHFEKLVPENWMDDIDQFGVYSYGSNKAIQLDTHEEE